LGVTISGHLARLLGGDIYLFSKVGAGSVFKASVGAGSFVGVELLTELNETLLPFRAPPDEWENIPLRGRILLVEDGRDNQRLICMHLRACGAEVVVAENGQIAVDMVATSAFDLILMDMQMPVMDGYSATKSLRSTGCVIPIVALTAYAMADDRKKCMDSGCTDYLSKPIDRQILLKKVSQYMEKANSTSSPTVTLRPAAASGSSSVASAGGSIKSALATQSGMMEIITEFVDGLPGEVKKMTDSLEKKDMTALRQVVHQLRGAAGGYGFAAVTQPATSVEKTIDASGTVEAITAEIKSLIEVVRRIDGYDEAKTTTVAAAVR